MFNEIVYNILVGLAMILATFVFHAYALDTLMRLINPLLPVAHELSYRKRKASQAMVLLFTSLGVICILSAEIWSWAFLYLYLDIRSVQNVETALYFSMVSFTTVGYGDVVLSANDRLLSGMQATSGMLLFGWSTAFMFEVLSLVYRHRPKRTE